VGKGWETSSVFSHLNWTSVRAVSRAEVHFVAPMTHRKTHSNFAVCASLTTTATGTDNLKLLYGALRCLSTRIRHFFYRVLFYLTTIVCHFPSIFCHVGCYNALNKLRGSDNRQTSDKITTLLLQGRVKVL
jgi:hypothetical protein